MLKHFFWFETDQRLKRITFDIHKFPSELKLSPSVLFFAYFYTCLMLQYTIFTIWINNIQNEQKYIPHKSVIELEKLSGSILKASSTGRIVTSKEMKKIWPWNIQCGQCKIKLMLRLDPKSQGRLEHFKKVNYFLLSLLLFQATSFTQKMINSASKTTDTHKSQYA